MLQYVKLHQHAATIREPSLLASYELLLSQIMAPILLSWGT